MGYRIGTAPVSFSPTLHHHLGTRVEPRSQIEELLEEVEVPLLLDTDHLARNRAFLG